MSIIKHFSQGNQDSEETPSDYWRGHDDGVQSANNKIYNQAIQDAIEIVKQSQMAAPLQNPLGTNHFQRIISRLQSLKK